MTKAGPAMMKRALYQAGNIARRYDPQLAYLYYREMVHHGKTHLQAMGAVMSHLAARILTVLREDRPYELRDIDNKLIGKKEAIELIRSQFQVPEDIRQVRRHRKTQEGRPERHGAREAAKAPQSRQTSASPVLVYSADIKESTAEMGA
jgi:hypothetical protein